MTGSKLEYKQKKKHEMNNYDNVILKHIDLCLQLIFLFIF